MARSAGHFLPYAGVCFISERPAALRFDARQRWHNETGPALAFRDGLRRSYIKGVRVPNWLTEQPHLLTVERIDAETNAEARRVMLERYGWQRFLRDGKAEEVHRDLTGTLYRRPMAGEEDLVMVHVVNKTQEPDGTYKEYFLRVPPTMRTAHQAVAWTFGLRPEEYHPVRET